MTIEFKELKNYNKKILYEELVMAYSFDNNWRKVFNDEWIKYDNFIFNNLEFTNKCGFVTTLNNIPIGHITWNPSKKSIVEIGHNVIITKYKGNNYGYMQLSHAIDIIKQDKNVKKIIVITNDNLIPAKNNYLKCGFKIKKYRHCDYNFMGDYLDLELDTPSGND